MFNVPAFVFIAFVYSFSISALAAPKTVAIAADSWCPYNCDQTSRDPGFMVAIARDILSAAGYKVTYTNLPWTEAMNEVLSGRLDAIIGASVGEARNFKLAGEPLGENKTCFYTRMEDPFLFKPGATLTGRRLGVASGYLYGDDIDHYIKENRDDYNLVQIVTGDKPLLQNIRKLKERRIDTLIENRLVMEFSIRKYRVDGFRLAGCEDPTSLHIAFSPKRDDAGRLAEVINSGIREFRKNGRLAAILASYGVPDWK